MVFFTAIHNNLHIVLKRFFSMYLLQDQTCSLDAPESKHKNHQHHNQLTINIDIYFISENHICYICYLLQSDTPETGTVDIQMSLSEARFNTVITNVREAIVSRSL